MVKATAGLTYILYLHSIISLGYMGNVKGF
jgi:hypothetical protein